MSKRITSPNLEFVSADPVTQNFAYRTKNGKLVTLIKEENVLIVSIDGQETGTISIESNQPSGVIGGGDMAIGEYCLEEGEYVVTPYDLKGFKEPDKKEKIHPLDYFMRGLE